jgi:hypothetical protein
MMTAKLMLSKALHHFVQGRLIELGGFLLCLARHGYLAAAHGLLDALPTRVGLAKIGL